MSSEIVLNGICENLIMPPDPPRVRTPSNSHAKPLITVQSTLWFTAHYYFLFVALQERRIYTKFAQSKYNANIYLLYSKPVANMVNAAFATIFTQVGNMVHMLHLPRLLKVCSRVNICLHYICAVQIWWKSIFSCSDIAAKKETNRLKIGLKKMWIKWQMITHQVPGWL